MSTPAEFLQQIKDGALLGWEQNKILPSITAAQGALESAWGTSELATKANNLFGIKGDYEGYAFFINTKEFIDGKEQTVRDHFRHYPDPGKSLEDHGAFFTSTDWRTKNYAAVIGETDYKKAAQALQDSGYATDPKYAQKLIAIIEKHQLQNWDPKPKKEPAPAPKPDQPKKEDPDVSKLPGLVIDPGHGGSDPGATGFGVQEKTWNLKISLYQHKRLKELGANVSITRTTDKTLNSKARTDLIKRTGAKYCISNHWNAFNGSARGIETIHSIYANPKKATDIAHAIRGVTKLPLRRVFKRTNSSGGDYYFMHRLTGSVQTTIIEYGFLDNRTDHQHYANDKNFYDAAEAVIKALCPYLKVEYKTPGQTGKTGTGQKSSSLTKVQAGSFGERLNAENLKDELESKGYEVVIHNEPDGYKVIVGHFGVLDNARKQKARLENQGYEAILKDRNGNVIK